jgi:hypothetical protein
LEEAIDLSGDRQILDFDVDSKMDCGNVNHNVILVNIALIIVFQHFMEPEGSLPYSEEPSIPRFCVIF